MGSLALPVLASLTYQRRSGRDHCLRVCLDFFTLACPHVRRCTHLVHVLSGCSLRSYILFFLVLVAPRWRIRLCDGALGVVDQQLCHPQTVPLVAPAKRRISEPGLLHGAALATSGGAC